MISLETYFVPGISMFENTYFDVWYPDEIILPDGDLDLADHDAVD